MSRRISHLVTACVEDTVRGSRCTVEDVVRCVYQRHGDAVDEHGAYLAHHAVAEIVRKSLRRMSNEGEAEQLSLPGVSLPATIAVLDEESGQYEYVDAHVATWRDLESGRHERLRNVAAAQARLDEYDAALRELRPHMEGTTRSVAEALRAMQEDAA